MCWYCVNVCNLLVQCFVFILSIPCEFLVNKLFSVVIWMNECCMVCTQVKSYDFLTLHDADLIVPSDYGNAPQSMIVHTFQQIWFTILFTRLHMCRIMKNYAVFLLSSSPSVYRFEWFMCSKHVRHSVSIKPFIY